jgi:CHAT domain-containing protein
MIRSYKQKIDSATRHSPLDPRERFSTFFKLILLVVLFAFLISRPRILHSEKDLVDRQLAEAYSEKRTLELRIAGAAYSPLRKERGATASALDWPKSLFEAEEVIDKQLTKNAGATGWLDASARVDLVHHDFERAIQKVQRALEAQPDSPQLLIDLASGYFEQAEDRKHAIDYGNAVEYLGQALKVTPDAPVALFNRAIVCEKMYLYTQAMTDWEHYLRIDPKGSWSAEAASRLQKLKEKVDQQERAVAEPLLAPAELRKLSVRDADSLQRVDKRIEDYLNDAVEKWLPRAYPLDGATTREAFETRSALRVLAHLLRERHDDPWLNDVLSAASSAEYPQAVAALSSAAIANDDGDTDAAQHYAARAAGLFTSISSPAGALRARMESIFASHFAQDGESCLRSALAAQNAIEHSAYRWIRIQYHLEAGTCFWFKGSIGKAGELYQKAAMEADREQVAYPALYLRSQDHLAAFYSNSGKIRESLDKIQEELRTFWTGTYPAMRGYNFYYNLGESARTRKQAHLQLSAWENGVTLSESFPDTTLRAMAHSLMADAALAVGQPEIAASEVNLAEQYFNDSAKDGTRGVARVEAETRLAEAEIGLGKLQEAASHMPPLESKIAQSDSFLALLYYTNRGELETRLNDTPDAEASLRLAISIAEKDLTSLRSQQDRLQWGQKSSAAYRNFTDLKLRQGNLNQALEIWEWYRGAALRSENGAADAPSKPRKRRISVQPGHGALEADLFPELKQVSRTLPALDHETVLSYMRLREKYVGWAYDDRGIFAFTIPATAAYVDSVAGNFRRLCSDPKSDLRLVRKQARTLYDLLIAPAEAKAPLRESLTIEADGAVNGLAFEALLDPQDRYMGERYSLNSSLGLYYLPLLHSAQPITADSRAVVAFVPLPHFSIDDLKLQYLADADGEGRMVRSKFHSAKLLEDREATVAALRPELARREIFHFAGHALALPGQTGLLLSDALFGPEALKGIDLKYLQLAVLSACDTAGQIEGDEYNPDSLVHPFVFAGVPRVVVSRWNVDSEATREFMELFYQNLLKGKTTPEALKNAEEGLRRDTKHPYYWAAFTEFGTN